MLLALERLCVSADYMTLRGDEDAGGVSPGMGIVQGESGMGFESGMREDLPDGWENGCKWGGDSHSPAMMAMYTLSSDEISLHELPPPCSSAACKHTHMRCPSTNTFWYQFPGCRASRASPNADTHLAVCAEGAIPPLQHLLH